MSRLRPYQPVIKPPPDPMYPHGDPFDLDTTDGRDNLVRNRWIRERDGWRAEAATLRLEREQEMVVLRQATRQMTERLQSTLDAANALVKDLSRLVESLAPPQPPKAK